MTGSKDSSTADIFEISSNSGGSSFDVRAGAPRIEYRESMIDNTIRLTAAIVDTGQSSSSVSEALTLQGGEKVLFKYTDAAGNVLDFSDGNSLRLSNKNLEIRSFKSSSFIAQIVAKEFLDNKLLENRVTKRYSGKISKTVESILREDLKTDKDLFVSETLNTFSDFGLRKEPFDVILELQTMAIPNLPNAKGKTAGFFFWQTSKGFYFKSADEIFNGTPIKTYVYNFKSEREEVPVGYDDKILDANYVRVVDVERQLDNNAFGISVEPFNPSNLEFTKSFVEGVDSKILSGLKSPDFGEFKGATDFVGDIWNSVGNAYGTGDSYEQQLEKSKIENFNITETLGQSIQNYRQRLNFMLEVKIPGDFSLKAGDIIRCDLPELSSKTTLKESPLDSGIYMILELCHYISPTQTYTGLVLVRDSFGVKA
jgi:hypothetical protein